MGTKKIILDKALELFNNKGIEEVGIRDIAAELGIRPGNITYYFPKKDDILVALGAALSELNTATIVKLQEPAMYNFMERYRQVFNNHYQYRCLFLSFVSIMQKHTALSVNYGKVEKERQEEFRIIIGKLSQNGYLDRGLSKADIDHLVSFLSLVARFWISESTVSYKKPSKKQAINHYLNLIAFVFSKHATKKGKEEIDQFLAEIA